LAPPCECKNREIKLLPFENGASRGAMAYLKVEKPRFLFLEGSTSAVAVADVATVALPGASAARAGTSAAHAASSVDRLAAGTPTSAPGARSSAASVALGEGGAGSHLSGGPAPCRFLPPLPLPTTSTPTSPREKVPAAHATGIPRPFVPGAPTAGSSTPSYTPPAPAPAAAPRARARARGVDGSDRAAFTVTLCWEERNVRVAATRGGRVKVKGEEPTHWRGVGKHNERPGAVVAVPYSLEADGAPRPRGRVLQGEAVVYQPRARWRHRVGRLIHLKDAELALHERDDPPVVEVREDRSCAQPSIR
jgi:hypothetical protein